MGEITDIRLWQGDCLDLMNNVEDKSIDLILCDLPYGSTKNKWDSAIPLDQLWVHYDRIIKDKGAIVLFAQTPFDKILGGSNLKMLKYEWIWEKEQGTGHLNSNFAPMKKHENILVFSKKSACYVKNKDNAMVFFPQMGKGTPYTTIKGSNGSNYDMKWDKKVTTENKGERYPTSILKFKRDKEKFHPTQKPVDLLEYLINTYTNENDLVLDNCMGSGSTGVACKNLSRKFIGIELNEKYFEIAKTRIA